MLAPGHYYHVSMTYHMPSLIKKKILRGKPYYYLRECQRVNSGGSDTPATLVGKT